MSPMTFIGSSDLELQPTRSAAAAVQPGKAKASGFSWRFQRKEENIALHSWFVAIAATFLLTGLAGIINSEAPLQITLSGRAGQGASDAESTDLTMAELHAMEEAPEVTSVEEVLPQVLEVPTPVEMPQELLDLPELAEALVTEDVFTVPAAPKIETALKPVDPAKPKPTPKPRPAKAQPRSSRATTVASGTQGGTTGSGGGAGGSGATGSGSGRGKFPKPNYPSSARSRGVSGSITLALAVSPSGQVESASAVSCRGNFSSSEQDSVASFVRRNWKFPPGAYRKHNVNIVFNLSSR